MATSFGGSSIARARALYSAGGSVPLWVPPAFLGGSPNALDDELDGSLVTLAAPWQIFDDASQVNLPITGGAIDRSAPPSAGTVRAQVGRRRSWLQMQLPSNQCVLHKPWTPPSSDWFLWCRASADVGPNPSRVQLIITPNHATVSNAPRIGSGIATYFAVGTHNNGGVASVCEADSAAGAGSTTGYDVSTNGGSNARPDYFGIWKKSGSNTLTLGVWSEGCETIVFPAVTLNFTIQRVGLRMVQQSASGQVFATDFLRLDTVPRWSA